MSIFPAPHIYEQLYEYSPWGKMMSGLLSWLQLEIQPESKILDIMCGTGYLLREIRRWDKRVDLLGLDSNFEFINYAMEQGDSINYILSDGVAWKTEKKFDFVICTGGLHHVSPAYKVKFLRNVASKLDVQGVALFADPYISPFTEEIGRKLAAAQLGVSYLDFAIKNKAPDAVIAELINILENDILEKEFKTSVDEIVPVFRSVFKRVNYKKVWPAIPGAYGDYYFICSL